MKKSGSTLKTIICVAIMILLVVGFYFAISSRDSKKDASEEKVKSKNAETLLKKNLEKEYPLTPTAVVSYYSDLLLAYYKENCDDSVREKLVEQSRLLYDEELLEANEEKDQLVNLQANIEKYEEKEKQIINYTVCEPEKVEYGDLDGARVALVNASYRVREKKELSDVKEEYFLKKDADGYWKIVGWRLQTGRSSKSQ